MSQIILTESTSLVPPLYTLILRNCNYRLLSNNYSINHKLALWVLCKNNATVSGQVSTYRDC